jgi:hypothetical protein
LEQRPQIGECLSTCQLVQNIPDYPMCGLSLAQFGTYCQNLSGWHFPPTRNPRERRREAATKRVSRLSRSWPFGCDFGPRRLYQVFIDGCEHPQAPRFRKKSSPNRNEHDKPPHSHRCRMDSCWSVRARGCGQLRARSSSQHRCGLKRVDTRRDCSCHGVALHRGGRMDQG